MSGLLSGCTVSLMSLPDSPGGTAATAARPAGGSAATTAAEPWPEWPDLSPEFYEVLGRQFREDLDKLLEWSKQVTRWRLQNGPGAGGRAVADPEQEIRALQRQRALTAEPFEVLGEL
jgi:hypothetical protein